MSAHDNETTETLFEEGRNCHRVLDARQVSVIVDAADYFRVAREAMLAAKTRVMLVGWDFDARIELHGDPLEPGEPRTVGKFILWLVRRNPKLDVYLLRWDMGALKSLFRGTTPITIARWMLHRRIHTRLDGYHPTGASHHQKIVVIDDCLAFCGGIDMTSERWDTRGHEDENPDRVTPRKAPYPPWHDATTALSGPVAAGIADVARDRWVRAGGKPLAPVTGVTDCWPKSLEPQFQTCGWRSRGPSR
jgi:phosphatidylserine/phosphatidylglycerophosphate/cardiolipin synthase-like enzyme